VNSPLSRVTTRVIYGASQLPRIAWYVGHSLAVRRLSERAPRRDDNEARPRAHTKLPVPDRKRLYADMAILLQQDLANVEAGFYPMPADHDGSLLTLLHRSRLFFDDLPAIHRRRENGSHNDVLTEETRGKRPRYYLQNFHFQTGGWMTDDSASRYDTQVEVLFNGTALPMRHAGRPCLNSMKSLPDETNVNYDFSTSAAARGDFSIL
jgi:hypothetical protein